MAGMFGYSREAVRVKVKKCESNLPPEWRKFSVDPQITSLEVLFSILAKAFDLKTDFGISYKAIDPTGHETYLPVLSDWDLDAAFLRAHNLSITTSTEPCLNLRVDIKPFSEAQDWDMTTSQAPRETVSLQQSLGVGQRYVQNVQNRLPGLIMNQMEKTLSMVQRALNLVEDPSISQPPRLPLCDSEFRGFLDSVGQIIKVNELRKVIYSGGIDPSLRRVVWKHILNVYPEGMTGRERMDYMKQKASEYYKLRDAWRAVVQKGTVVAELTYVTSMVRKDVLRTDRLHPFYAGSDDNQNIAALFNILTTYALNHPAVSYCQGMSDIASPLLVTMGDEAQAYICFCAVMTRLCCNFMLDGIAMTQKFTHLSEALQYYDPEFYEYLKEQQADDLLFCYRWLLLEMKREFAFEDSLRMLEVLWSSLPPAPPIKELALFEKKFEPPLIDIPPPKSPSVILRTPRENPYTKICALRRQSSALSLVTITSSHNASSNTAAHKLDGTKRMNQSLDENLTRYRSKSFTKTHQSLDETKIKLLSEMEQLNLKTAAEKKQKNLNLSINNDSYDLDTKNKSVTVEEKLNENEKSCKLLSKHENEPKHGSQQHAKQNNIHKHKTLSQINNKALFSYSTGNLMSKQGTIKKGGHFKDLKERIAASKKGIFSSLDKIENIQTCGDTNNIIDNNELTLNESNIINENNLVKKSTKGQKVVKNFNEFLNFASINKSRISDKLSTKKLQSITLNDNKQLTENINNDFNNLSEKPSIKLTKSSFDDSDLFDINLPIASTSNVKPLTLQLNSFTNVEQTINKQICNFDGSSPDDSQEYFPMTTSMTRELRLELENLDRHVFGTDFQRKRHQHELNILTGCDITPPEVGELCNNDDENENKKPNDCKNNEITYEKLTQCSSLESVEVHQQNNEEPKRNKNHDNDIEVCSLPIEEIKLKRFSSCSINNDVFIWENPLHQFDAASSQPQFRNQSICNDNIDIENDDKTMDITTINCINNITTPDEQAELEYDGEIIEETINGKKSVTPIRLLRKNIGEQQFLNSNKNKSKIRNTTKKSFKQRNNNRSSLILNNNNNNIDDTDSDENSDNNWRDNSLMATKTNHELLTKNFTQDNNRKLLINNDTINIMNPTMTNSCEEASEIGDSTKLISSACNLVPSSTTPTAASTATSTNNILLPQPNDFGGGNPFLMFLCLTLLLQHRDYVIKSNMDYNEMAMHFDKMVRKHNVTRVLNQARRMYSEYLKSQTTNQNSNYNVNGNLIKSTNASASVVGKTIMSPTDAPVSNTPTEQEHSTNLFGNGINPTNLQTSSTREINT